MEGIIEYSHVAQTKLRRDIVKLELRRLDSEKTSTIINFHLLVSPKAALQRSFIALRHQMILVENNVRIQLQWNDFKLYISCAT